MAGNAPELGTVEVLRWRVRACGRVTQGLADSLRGHARWLKPDDADEPSAWRCGLRERRLWASVAATAVSCIVEMSPHARALADALEVAVPRVTFQIKLLGSQRLSTRLDPVALRAAWPNLGWQPFMATEVEAGEADFADLRDALRFFLGQFYDSDADQVGCGASYVVTGVGGPLALDRFAKDMVLAATVLGPHRTVAYLDEWACGVPMRATHVMVLRGLRIEKDTLHVSEGVRLRRTPDNVGDLIRDFGPPSTMVSPGADFAATLGPSGATRMLNGLALCADVIHEPVFCIPDAPMGGLPVRKTETELDLRAVVDGLSLACNNAVAVACGWRRIETELHAFRGTGGNSVGTGFWDVAGSAIVRHSPVEAEDVAVARSIAERLTRDDAASPRTRLAIRRWKKSGTVSDVADQFIELRIALEALYADGNTEASYKVASRCARHLRECGDGREKLYREVKAFYNRASRFAHGHAMEAKEADRVLVEKVRSTCRDGLLKILDKPVDLMALSLG